MVFVILEPSQENKSVECIPITVCPVDIVFDEYDLTPDQEIYLEETDNFYGR